MARVLSLCLCIDAELLLLLVEAVCTVPLVYTMPYVQRCTLRCKLSMMQVGRRAYAGPARLRQLSLKVNQH
ncbi:hypothetical protein F5X98DRAFT_345190 [Xylaria grammica]|nr:hypothetical protein F5X98DRAFT_345190 [Xylaria grammica]